jgi:mercuric ion transport protein
MTVTQSDESAPRTKTATPGPSTGWLAGFGVTFGLGALLSSSCCAVPLALAGLGASGAVFSGLEFLVNWRSYFLGGAILMLLTAWAFFIRRRAVTCNIDGICTTQTRPRSTALLLSFGTALIAMSLAWDPLIEPLVFKLVR